MELQKISSSSVAGISANSVDGDARLKGVKPKDPQKNDQFKDEISRQVEQVKANNRVEKNENNQSDIQKVDEAPAVSENANSVADNELSETRDGITLDDSVDTVEGDLSLSVEAQTTDALAGVNLPVEGKLLPLSESLTPVMPVEMFSVTGKDGVPKTQQQVEMDIALAKQQSTLVNQAMTNSKMGDSANQAKTEPATQNLTNLGNETTQNKFFSAQQNIASQPLEKINIQDARYSKILSDVPAADAIQQASRLQQVPVTTAISAAALTPPMMNGDVNATPLTTNGLSQTLGSSLSANIQSSNWSQQMTQQVSYMIKGGFQQAEIKLNPANLGPMEIKLSLNDDKASITFVTQHAPVRDAIDAAMPRLKDMLEQQGINLADVDVSTQSEQQQAQQERESNNPSVRGMDSDVNDELSDSEIGIQKRVTLDESSGVSIFA